MAASLSCTRISLVCKRFKILAKRRGLLDYISRNESNMVVNHNYQIDPVTKEKLDNEEFSHRKHSGVMTLKRVTLPDRLEDAIFTLVDKYPLKDLLKNSEKLVQYLWSRHPPAEQPDIQLKAQEIEESIIEKEGEVDESSLSPEEKQALYSRRKGQLLKQLRQKTYRWQATRYNAQKSLLYLTGRMVRDYSALLQIFKEMEKREPMFDPSTLFDFGSGVGSVTWAAHQVWGDAIKEFHNVDISSEMNTVARLLLQDGDENTKMSIDGVFFRQFLPSSSTEKSNIVVSSYSLMELPSQEDRLKTVDYLWRKTSDFLVLVESGTKSGHNLILEARDFILQSSFNESDGDTMRGHVFSPCPHDLSCPKKNEKQPCNFSASYKSLNLTSREDLTKHEKYSYVVMRKGSRTTEEQRHWPRLINPLSKPAKHVHCRMCTTAGKLEHAVITAKKQGKDLYWCARRSNWGDLLPAVPAPETTPDSDPNAPTETTKVWEKASERDDINYIESARDDLSGDPTDGYESDSSYTAEQLDTLNEQAILMSQNNAHLNDCDFSQTSSSELQGLTSH